MLDLSVVIVNHKTKDLVNRCLDSLFLDATDSGLNFSTVVVDNASDDGLESLIKEKFPAVKFMSLAQNTGFGRAQNTGIKAAPAKHYFILNPDTYFPPNQTALRRLFDFMEEHPRVGVVGPKILYPDGSLQYSCYRFPSFWQPFFSRTKFGQSGLGQKINEWFLMKDFDHNTTSPVDWVMGSAMLARHEAVERVGVFDENFWMYAEDSDLCRRMWEAGWPVYYLPEVVVHHEHRRGSASVPGVFMALLKNKLSRIHLLSWLKYNWKWRNNKKYYEPLP